MLEVLTLVVGRLQTNCYLAFDNKSLNTIIIDPGDDADYIIRKINEFNLIPKFVMATHGHFDHLLAATEVKLAFKIPFLLHQDDLFLLKRAKKTANYFGEHEVIDPPVPDAFLFENMKIKLGNQFLKVITTPGHTPGSVCLYSKGFLLSGDTLFYHSVGRTDFGYAKPKALEISLNKLFSLPDSTRVLPGHGDKTRIGEEKRYRQGVI